MRPVLLLLAGCAAAALWTVVGCTPNFEDVWLIKDLRILGVQAEPPEVLVPIGSTVFPPVHLQALIRDPQAAPEALFDWELWACTADEIRCEEAEQQQRVAQGHSRLSDIKADFVLDEALLRAALAVDVAKERALLFGGVPVMVELQVRREGFADRAIKRIVYGYPIPAQKTANANPSLARVLVDGKELPAGQDLVAKPSQEVKLLPDPRPGAAESYWVATFTGGSRQLTEYLSYSFFTTAGSLSDGTTGGKPSPFVENKKIADPSSTWTAPSTPGDAELWFVVRDDRGGINWTRLTAKTR